MKVCVFVTAILLATANVPATAEIISLPSDEELLRSADYCVVAMLGDDLSLVVSEEVFGHVPAAASLPRLPKYRNLQPTMKCVVFLVQEGREITCPWSQGYREVIGDEVMTSDEYMPIAIVNRNTAPFPTALPAYIRELQMRAKAESKARQMKQSEALDQVFDRARYFEKSKAAPVDLEKGVLSSVHADDHETLQRMVTLVQERPEPMYVHARGSFVQVIARKWYEAGFDAIRLEATRNSTRGQNWSSERDAIWALETMGSKKDIELLKELITKLYWRRELTLEREAFPVLGSLANRFFSYDGQERQDLRIWLEEGFCWERMEDDAGAYIAPYAGRALGILGRKESLPRLQKLNALEANQWLEEAISRIKQRVEEEKKTGFEQNAPTNGASVRR